VIRIQPDHVEAFINRGATFEELKRFEDALASYGEAIRLKPDYAEVFSNRGNVLRELRRLDDALTSYAEAIRLKPNYAEAFSNRGIALKDFRRLDDALASYAEAIRLKPDFAEAFANRGFAFKRLRRFDEALASFAEAIRLKPDHAFILGNAAHAGCMICEWSGLEDIVKKIKDGLLSDKPMSDPFSLLALVDDPKIHLRLADTWVKEKFQSLAVLPHTIERQRGKKIHIAYLSADFRDHPISYLMAELFESHDRSRFELTAISFGPGDGTEMRARVAAAFDRFEDVRQMSDVDVARRCRELGVDIAVDLMGYTADSRTGILAERCAPIQINWLGYAGTMAAPFIDYIVADRTLIAEADLGDYTEKVIWLPDTFLVNDGQRRIADRAFTRAECGLPESGFVFCCFNNTYKILPETFDVWMRILERVPGSTLWLFEGNATAARNLRAAAKARGIDPGRLVFAKRLPLLAEHLARCRVANLFIDTWPYNAHATACDALWAGLPLLTRPGRSFASRVAASLLRAIGLPELITHSNRDYEELAVALAQDTGRLKSLRDRLAVNRLTHPLFDCKRFTLNLESAYQQVAECYWAGKEPDHLMVQAPKGI